MVNLKVIVLYIDLLKIFCKVVLGQNYGESKGYSLVH